MNGFLLIDKPKEWTSFNVVKKVSHLLGERKVGHAGTLDKLAVGLVILAFGEATKLLEFLIGLDKEYEVEMKFGAVSETYDSEGPIKEIDGFNAEKILKKEFEKGLLQKVKSAILENFVGEIDQVPPKYSAVKIAGKRASDRIRKGEVIEMKSKKINIYNFEILNFDWPKAKFKVECSSGTYIRSLVHDLGAKLGWGAYVTDLRRTKIGGFAVNEAINLEKLIRDSLNNKSEQELVSVEKFVQSKGLSDRRILELSDVEFLFLRDGRVLKDKKVEQDVLNIAVYKGKVVGILENFADGIKFKKQIC